MLKKTILFNCQPSDQYLSGNYAFVHLKTGYFSFGSRPLSKPIQVHYKILN